MKFKVIAVLLVTIFSFGSLAANAQVNTNTESQIRVNAGERKDLKNEFKDKRDAMRSEFKSEMKDMKSDIKEMRASSSVMIKNMKASSSMMFKMKKEEARSMEKKMKKDTFVVRRDALLKELNFSLTNMLNIRSKINDRIIRLETEGTNMTEAKASLLSADDKLAKARIAVDLFASSTVSVNNNTSASTTIMADIELEKPRKLGDSAIKAVKEARDALKKVIEVTAKSKTNINASSTSSN